MKTALVSHCWLDNNQTPGYRGRRVERFLNHYGNDTWQTVILDNGSDPSTCARFAEKHGVEVVNLHPHLKRGYPIGGTNHNYPSVWRAYWYVKELLERFERIYYISTDAYVVSQRLMDYLESIESGWTALWCPVYQCPEAQIQVITRCKEFEIFFAGPCDPNRYNGLWEEMTLPFTRVEKGFIGDRYGEFAPVAPFIAYSPGHDYYTQVPDHPDFDDSQFPVVRRVDGRPVVEFIA